MTTPIRPGFPQALPTPQRSNAALEAQRAFFQSALQGTAAPVRPAPQAAVQAAVQTAPPRAVTVVTTPTAQASAPDEAQAVRPGRYLDIRV